METNRFPLITIPATRKYLYNIVFFFLVFLCAGGIAAGKIHADSLTIGGTGGALGTVKILAEEFTAQNPAISVEVLPSLGSGGGIKAMMRGAIDVSVSARKLKDSERKKNLIEIPIGRTPFIVIVGKDNISNSISERELAEIYNGKRQVWPDGKPVRLVLRPERDTDTMLLRSISAEMDAAMDIAHKRPGLILGVTDQDSANRVESQPGSVGTSSLAQILTEKRNLKPLALDGVMPSPETLASKEYPFSKTYYFIVQKESSTAVKQLLRFVQSERGRIFFPNTDINFNHKELY